MRVYRIYMPVCLSNVQFLPTITLAKLTFPFAFNKLIDWLTLARLVLKQVQLWRLPGLWCNGILLNITVQTRTHYERLQFVENKAAGMWTVVSEAVDEIQLTLSDWRVLKRCHTHTQVRRTYANKSNELVERRELTPCRRRNGLLKNNSQKTTSLYRSSCFGPQHKTLAACCPVARDCVYAVNSTDRINVRNTDATDTVQTDGLMFSSVVTGGKWGQLPPPNRHQNVENVHQIATLKAKI